MKRIFIVLGLLMGWINLSAQLTSGALLPLPNHITQVKGKAFCLNNRMVVSWNHGELAFAAGELQRMFREELGLEVVANAHVEAPAEASRLASAEASVSAPAKAFRLASAKASVSAPAEAFRLASAEASVSAPAEASIRLLIDPSLKGSQHYLLNIDASQLCIKGSTPQAVYYGLQTLRQLLIGDPCAAAQQKLNPVTIDDEPRFPYRALMLDPARHFLPVNDVKFYIDQMVKFKYNVLQLHLTDDQGWRVEIKSRPELASKDHYTQTELKELIAYAAQRHVEIVPEMDIPGHTVAILAAHPELGCTSADTIAKEVGKTVNLMLCASVDKVYEVYQDIFNEMAALFPSKYIHLGGDESVIDKNWGRCSRCQQQMKERGYTQASQLMIPFFDRMLGMVEKAGKSPVLWCELDNIYPPANDYLFPYPKQVTLVTWRNGLTPKCIELTRQHGNPLIMAPGEYTYFDYPQLKGDLPEFNNWGMPVTTLQQAYAFDPGYGLPAADQAHIQGVMGTLWGEAMPDMNRVTYMTYPRALALAEAGWTQMEHRSWEGFKQRLFPNLYHLMKSGVSIRVPFEIVKPRK